MLRCYVKGLQGFPWCLVAKTLLCNSGGAGSNPSWGAKTPHASQSIKQKIKQKEYCNTFNKEF